MIQAAIFDMDGLLLDTERPAVNAWMRAAAELGLALPEEVVIRTVGRDWEMTKRIVEEELGEGVPLDALYQRTQQLYRQGFEDLGVPVKPGAPELLRELKARGILVGLATSTARKSAEWKLSSAGLLQYFDGGACGDEVQRGKPYPDIYLLAARTVGADPARTVALEDSPAGLAAARAAGMRTIMVPDLVPPSEETLPYADHVAEDLFRAGEYLLGPI